MNELQQVHNIVNIENIRGYVEHDGTVFLNLEDICIGLGYTQIAPSGNVVIMWHRVENIMKTLNNQGVDTSVHGNVIYNNLPEYIPENLFYLLSMRSRSKNAIVFQQKIANEILPIIRRTGMYFAEDVYNYVVNNPGKLGQLLLNYEEEMNKLKPKAEAYDQFMNSTHGYDMGTASKILRFQAPQRKKKVIGRNQMFQILRELNILQSDNIRWNIPFQEYVDAGYFNVIGVNGNSPTRNHARVEVLPLGLDFIWKLLTSNGYELVPREPVPLAYDNLTEMAI